MSSDPDGLELLGLKHLPRAGWVRRGVPAPESVAAHSWGVALLVLRLLPAHLDTQRALAYAVLHDLPEVRAGDITPADQVAPSRKSALESEAMEGLCAELPRGAEFLDLWRRYEAGADEEARFVRQLDKVDMALQALAYARQGHTGMEEFARSARQAVSHPELVRIVEQVLREITASR